MSLNLIKNILCKIFIVVVSGLNLCIQEKMQVQLSPFFFLVI